MNPQGERRFEIDREKNNYLQYGKMRRALVISNEKECGGGEVKITEREHTEHMFCMCIGTNCLKWWEYNQINEGLKI